MARPVAAVASLALVAGGVLAGTAPAYAATDAVLSIEKTTATATVMPGESLVWEVTIGCESLDTICADAVFQDAVPAEFTVADVRVTGATNAPAITVTGSDVSVAFADADPRFPGVAGILDGQRVSVLITSVLRGDIPASRDGETVTNTGTVSASNATTKTSDASVALSVMPTVAVATTKSWKPSQQLAGDIAPSTVALTVANTSNIAADALTLVEPASGHDPFSKVAFAGFGALAFPAGADRVALTVTTPSGTTVVPAAETLVFPDTVQPADVTGFTLAFSSSQGAARILPAGGGGTPASIAYQVVQRSLPTDTTTTVANRVAATVSTSRGAADATADASLVVQALTTKVTASKLFAPDVVNRGDFSTVVIGAQNDSNTPFTSMTITEPSPGSTDLAANGLEFLGLGANGDGNATTGTAAAWPSGATSASLAYHYADGPGAPVTIVQDDLAELPAPVEGKHVVGFTLTWEGTIAPGAKGTMPFRVLTSAGTPKSVTNLVQATASGPAGTIAPSVASAALEVKNLEITSDITKSMSPQSGANSPDQEFVTTLSATPSGNAPVHTLVLEDQPGSPLWSAFSATRVTTTTVPGNATLAVNTWDGATWVPVAVDLTGAVELALPAGAKGIQFVYTSKAGAELTRGTSVTAKFIVKLDAALSAPDSFRNCAVSTVAGAGSLVGGSKNPACATVAIGTSPDVTPILKVSTTKSWTGPLIVASDPAAALPSTTMTVAVKNTSGITVSSLTLTDPVDGATPFEYFDITDVVSISLPTGHDPASTSIVLSYADGSSDAFTGASGLSAVRALTKADLADVVSIQVTAAGVIPNDKSVTMVLKTQLRATLRTGGAVITVPEGGKLTVGNEVRGTATNATSSVSADATASVDVYRETDVPLGATLTKSLSPASGTIYTQNPRIVKLALGITRSAGDVGRYVIEDTTPTFWNAFTANGTVRLTNPSSSANIAITARVDYLSGATFTEAGADVVVTGGSWTEGTAFTLPGKTSVVPTDRLPAIPVGEVQGVRVVFEANGGSTLSNSTYRAEFDTVTRATLRSGGPVTDVTADPMPGEHAPGVATNIATATVTNKTNKTADVVPATATFTFTTGTPGVAIEKTPAMNTLVPGEKQQFKLTVRNTGSTAIVNPVIQDVVPHDATAALLVREAVRTGEITYAATPTIAGITTDPADIDVAITMDDPGSGEQDKRTRYTFTFPQGTMLLPGQAYTVTIPMEVRAGVARDTVFDNTFAFTADGGISTTTTAKVRVLEGGSYYRTKDVKEDLAPGQPATGLYNTLDMSDACLSDGGFYRVPCVVKTQPGATETWRLRVMNTGNLPTTTLTMVDVLPYPGDTGSSYSLSEISRGSTWTPEFIGNLDFFDEPENTTRTIWYQTAAQERCVFGPNPNSPDPFGATCDDWLTTAPADPTDITAIKIEYRFATALQPGDGVGLTYQTRTLGELPTGLEPYLANGTPAPAWNSFVVFTTTDKGSGLLEYETLEPNKAGVAFSTPVAVGDYVWVDKNRNGLQDAGEPGLPGVTVTLHDAATGDVVGTTATDADGFYLFDELQPGEYFVTFELTPEQRERYTFTFERRGTDVTVDSNPDRATGRTDAFRLDAPSAADNMVPASGYDHATVTAHYINPTIDAGVIAASVSVGDYVWFDTNIDGIQGPQHDVVDPDTDEVLEAAEPGIEGVVLTITGPDGKPVTDVFGDPVGAATTDEHGHYLFEHLPLLEPVQSYRVSIDYPASGASLENLFPTLAGAGADRSLDSSTNFADSGELVEDRASDLTLDFGFYYLELPTHSLPPGLVVTGLGVGPALGALALLMGGGIALVLVSRGRRQER